MAFHVLNFYVKKDVIRIIYNNYVLVPQGLLAWENIREGIIVLNQRLLLALGHGSSIAHYKKTG